MNNKELQERWTTTEWALWIRYVAKEGCKKDENDNWFHEDVYEFEKVLGLLDDPEVEPKQVKPCLSPMCEAGYTTCANCAQKRNQHG